MTLLYTYNNKEYTLERLLKENKDLKEIWDNTIKNEKLFWKGIDDEDLIVETSDAFEEEVLADGYEILYEDVNDTAYDKEFLLGALNEH